VHTNLVKTFSSREAMPRHAGMPAAPVFKFSKIRHVMSDSDRKSGETGSGSAGSEFGSGGKARQGQAAPGGAGGRQQPLVSPGGDRAANVVNGPVFRFQASPLGVHVISRKTGVPPCARPAYSSANTAPFIPGLNVNNFNITSPIQRLGQLESSGRTAPGEGANRFQALRGRQAENEKSRAQASDRDEDLNKLVEAISLRKETELEKKKSELQKLQAEKSDLEKSIGIKQGCLNMHQMSFETLVESKKKEVAKVQAEIDKIDEEENTNNKVINEYKVKIEELQLENRCLKSKKNGLVRKKGGVEFGITMENTKEKGERENIEKQLGELKSKLSETLKKIENLPNSSFALETIDSGGQKQWKVEYLQKQITEKEETLECPVCFLTAGIKDRQEIFMCSEQHLVCSVCRPRLTECPTCRERFYGRARRHRFAEKMAEELVNYHKDLAEALNT